MINKYISKIKLALSLPFMFFMGSLIFSLILYLFSIDHIRSSFVERLSNHDLYICIVYVIYDFLPHFIKYNFFQTVCLDDSIHTSFIDSLNISNEGQKTIIVVGGIIGFFIVCTTVGWLAEILNGGEITPVPSTDIQDNRLAQVPNMVKEIVDMTPKSTMTGFPDYNIEQQKVLDSRLIISTLQPLRDKLAYCDHVYKTINEALPSENLCGTVTSLYEQSRELQKQASFEYYRQMLDYGVPAPRTKEQLFFVIDKILKDLVPESASTEAGRAAIADAFNQRILADEAHLAECATSNRYRSVVYDPYTYTYSQWSLKMDFYFYEKYNLNERIRPLDPLKNTYNEMIFAMDEAARTRNNNL